MLARNVCFEDITNAVNRVDKLGLKRIVPLRTQPAHDDIDNVSIGFESDVPHVFCNLNARRHFAGRTNQIREQQKFLMRMRIQSWMRSTQGRPVPPASWM